MKKKYKPKCKVGDLLIWRNDKGLIIEVKTYPEDTSMFSGNTHYIIEWSEEQEDGSYIQYKESLPVEQFDDHLENKMYQHYPVKK
jgi:hypothetical protein